MGLFRPEKEEEEEEEEEEEDKKKNQNKNNSFSVWNGKANQKHTSVVTERVAFPFFSRRKTKLKI